MQSNQLVTGVRNPVLWGYGLGVLGILCFSVTLPVTKLGVSEVDSTLFGLGRSVVVSIPALLTLIYLRAAIPSFSQAKKLLLVALGVVVGFPWLSAMAMETVDGAQAGIVIAVLPLFTALAGAVIARQCPSIGFWAMAILGCCLVIAFVWDSHQNGLSKGDLLLLLASLVCAIGYAVGAELSKELGGMVVICWAVVLSVPFSLVLIIPLVPDQDFELSWQIWSSFLYVAFVSQWLAFVFWYKGLALGGVVRVSQVQLLQPFFTLVVAVILLGEEVDSTTFWFVSAVVMAVGVGGKMKVSRRL